MLSESATTAPGDQGPDANHPARIAVHATTDRVAWVILGLGSAILAVISIRLAREFTFIVDEWDILAHHVDGDLLTPYNGHLSAVPAAIYQGLAHTIGIGSYLPWTLIALGVFLAIPVAFVATHRRRIDPILVTIAALGIAWSWAAEGQILYGFLINFNIPILMLVVAWWAIRRDTLRHDLWAMGALVVALATSSVGVVVAFAIGVELLVARVPLRRLVRFAPPVAAWGLWWFFEHEATKPATLGERASYAWHTSVAILAGFTLGWKPGAALSAIVIVTVVGVAWKRWDAVDAHVVAIGATLVFFVALSAFSRAGDIALNPPDSARYVWVGDVLIVAALVWCVRGRRIPPAVWAVTGSVTLVGAIGLFGHLRDYRTYVTDYTARTRPFLVGAEAAGSKADPDRILPLNLIPVTVGEYLTLVDAVGSPVADIPFDGLGAESARADADRILADETGLRVEESANPAACRSVSDEPTAGTTRRDVLVEPGSTLAFLARTDTAVRVRRLAQRPPADARLTVPADRVGTVRTVRDESPLPWRVTLDDDVGDVRLCGP